MAGPYDSMLNRAPSYDGILDQRMGMLDQTSSGQAVHPQQVAKADMDSATFLGEMRKGLRRFGFSTIATTQAFAGSMLEPFAPEAGQGLIKEGLRTIERMPNEIAPAVEKWDDIKDFRTGLLKVGSAFGEGAPSAALAIGAGLGGRALGAGVGAMRGLRGTAAGEALTARAGFAGGMASMLPMEGGETALDLAQDPAAMANTTAAQRAGLVLGRGGVNAALENIVPQALVVPRLLGKAARIQPGLGAGLRNVGLIGAEGAVGEYGTEAAQELTGQYVQNVAHPGVGYDLAKAHEAGLSGAVVGGVMGGGAGVAQGIHSNLAPATDKAKELIGKGVDAVKGKVPTFDDLVAHARDYSEDPALAGEDLAKGTLAGIAKAAEAAGALRQYGVKGLDTAEDYLGKAYEGTAKFIAKNIKDPDDKAWFEERAAHIGAMTLTEWRMFKRDLANKSGEEFLDDTAVAATLLGRKVVKGAEKAGTWAKNAAQGFYNAITKGAEGQTASISAPDSKDRETAMLQLYAAAPGLKDTVEKLAPTLNAKRDLANFMHMAINNPAYLRDTTDPERVALMKEWSDQTGVDLPKLVDTINAGRNNVAMEEIEQDAASSILRKYKIDPAHHDDLSQVIADAGEASYFEQSPGMQTMLRQWTAKDMPKTDQLMLQQLKKKDPSDLSAKEKTQLAELQQKNDVVAESLFDNLKEAVNKGQLGAERALGAGQLPSGTEKISERLRGGTLEAVPGAEGEEGAEESFIDSATGNKWIRNEDGELVNTTPETSSPFTPETFKHTLVVERHRDKPGDEPSGTAMPVTLRPQNMPEGVKADRKFLNKLANALGGRRFAEKRWGKVRAGKAKVTKDGGLIMDINPMSLMATVQGEEFRDRFQEHVVDRDARPGASEEEILGQRFGNIMGTLSDLGIEIDPEALGLPPGEPIRIKVDMDLENLPDVTLLKRFKKGTNKPDITWADVSGKNRQAGSFREHTKRLDQFEGEFLGAYKKLKEEAEAKPPSAVAKRLISVARRRAQERIRHDEGWEREDPVRNPTYAEMDTALEEYSAAIPELEKQMELQAELRHQEETVRDAYKEKVLSAAEVQGLIDYYSGAKDTKNDLKTVMQSLSTIHEPLLNRKKVDTTDMAMRMQQAMDAIDAGQTSFEQTMFGEGEAGSTQGTIINDWIEFKYTAAQKANRYRQGTEEWARRRGLTAPVQAPVKTRVPPEAGHRMAVTWEIEGKTMKRSAAKYEITELVKTDDGNYKFKFKNIETGKVSDKVWQVSDPEGNALKGGTKYHFLGAPKGKKVTPEDYGATGDAETTPEEIDYPAMADEIVAYVVKETRARVAHLKAQLKQLPPEILKDTPLDSLDEQVIDGKAGRDILLAEMLKNKPTKAEAWAEAKKILTELDKQFTPFYEHFKLAPFEKATKPKTKKAKAASAPAAVTSDVTIQSGGAEGTDTLFAKIGAEFGMSTIAHSFGGHRVQEDSGKRVMHTVKELTAANDLLKKVNAKYLKRKFPAASPFVNNLLRRNYYQVKDSDAVIAVSEFDDKGVVKGGTAWAVYMGIELGKPTYVFDQKTPMWMKWDGSKFVESKMPPPYKNFAGVGTREILSAGEAAVRAYLTSFGSTKAAAPAAPVAKAAKKATPDKWELRADGGSYLTTDKGEYEIHPAGGGFDLYFTSKEDVAKKQDVEDLDYIQKLGTHKTLIAAKAAMVKHSGAKPAKAAAVAAPKAAKPAKDPITEADKGIIAKGIQKAIDEIRAAPPTEDTGKAVGTLIKIKNTTLENQLRYLNNTRSAWAIRATERIRELRASAPAAPAAKAAAPLGLAEKLVNTMQTMLDGYKKSIGRMIDNVGDVDEKDELNAQFTKSYDAFAEALKDALAKTETALSKGETFNDLMQAYKKSLEKTFEPVRTRAAAAVKVTDEKAVARKKMMDEIAARPAQDKVTFLKGTEYTHAQLDKLLQGWSKQYLPGVKLSLQIYKRQAGDPNGFIYRRKGTNTIYLADEQPNHLAGLGTLAHEFGHAMEYNAFAKASKDVQDKIRAAYKADVEALRTGKLTHEEVLARFGSAGRATEKVAQVGEKGLGLTSDISLRAEAKPQATDKDEITDDDEYYTSFPEWFANQFSRYVTQGIDKGLSPAEKGFWKRLIKEMKEFFTNVVKKLAPNTEFEAWVKSLAADAGGAGKGAGTPPPPPPTPPGSSAGSTPPPPPGPTPSGAKIPNKAAKKRFLAIIHSMMGKKKIEVNFDQKLADGIKGTYYTREQKLKQVRDAHRALGEQLKVEKNPKRVEELKEKLAKVDAREKDILADQAIQGFIDLAAGMELKAGLAQHETLHAAFHIFFDPEEKRVLGQAFTHGLAGKRLREIFKDDPVVLKRIKESGEEAAAYAFELWYDDPSQFQLGPRVENIFQQMLNFIRKLFGVFTLEEKAQMIFENLKSGRRLESAISPIARKLDKDKAWQDRAQDMLKDVGGLLKQGYDILLSPSYERLIGSNNPAMTMAAKLGYEATGEEGGEGGGMVQRGRTQYKDRGINQLTKIFKDLPEAKLKEMHQHMVFDTNPTDPELVGAVKALRQWYKDMYKYQIEAGVRLNDAGIKSNYYPLTWSPEKVLKDKPGFIKMLEENYSDKLLTAKKTANEIYESITSYIDRGEDLVNVMGADNEPLSESTKNRTLAFIAKKHRVPYMDEDPVHTAFRYAKQAVRQAEYIRAYGMKSERLKELKEEAVKTYGATAEDLALLNDYIDGLMGNKEIGMSRELKDLYGAMTVYQNYRLLPFSLFASLVDPFGIAIRTGRPLDAWDAFTYSMKNLFKEWKKDYTRDFWEQLAQDFGIIEHSGTSMNANNLYDGITLRGTTKDLNDKLFKFNLLSGWIRNNTIMAVKAGQFAIYRASEGKMGDHSKRFMEELGLEKDDVHWSDKDNRLLVYADELQAAGLSKKDAEATEKKMRNAIEKIVRQSLLNPSSAELPNWASNPYLLPVAHLKQFTFAFNATIVDRVIHEAKHGNWQPAMLSAAYVPSMIAADFLKDMIAGFGEEPPYKKNWGLYDYFTNGLSRSGLTGTGQFFSDASEDITRGGGGWESASGPTVQQMKQGLKAFKSGNENAITNFMIKSLPLQPVYRQHLGDPTGAPA